MGSKTEIISEYVEFPDIITIEAQDSYPITLHGLALSTYILKGISEENYSNVGLECTYQPPALSLLFTRLYFYLHIYLRGHHSLK